MILETYKKITLQQCDKTALKTATGAGYVQVLFHRTNQLIRFKPMDDMMLKGQGWW